MKEKKKYILRRVVLILLVLIILFSIWFLFFRKKDNIVRVIDQIDGYQYNLKNTDSNLYKDNYYKLKDMLKVTSSNFNEKNYAKLIAKLFVVDFYTLNNKVTNQDVGGDEFIYSLEKDNFINESTTGVYKYVKNNINGNRKQKLPEVSFVDIGKIESIEYKNKKKDYSDNNGYRVTLNLKYKKDLGYPKKVTVTLIHEGNTLSIIEVE